MKTLITLLTVALLSGCASSTDNADDQYKNAATSTVIRASVEITNSQLNYCNGKTDGKVHFHWEMDISFSEITDLRREISRDDGAKIITVKLTRINPGMQKDFPEFAVLKYIDEAEVGDKCIVTVWDLDGVTALASAEQYLNLEGTIKGGEDEPPCR